MIHFSIPVIIERKFAYHILAGPVAVDYPDIEVVDNLIQQCACSLNYRKKLYATLGSVPIVEPVRLQYLCQLMFSLIKNLTGQRSDNTIKNEQMDRFLTEANPFLAPAAPSYNVKSPILEKALIYIESHYTESIRLDDVANHVGLNPSYFSTIFKKEVKITFSQYIINKRINEACTLLKNTNRSLVDISLSLGFDNQSYFSRNFKKYMGMSPNQYRKSMV